MLDWLAFALRKGALKLPTKILFFTSHLTEDEYIIFPDKVLAVKVKPPVKVEVKENSLYFNEGETVYVATLEVSLEWGHTLTIPVTSRKKKVALEAAKENADAIMAAKRGERT